MRVRIFLIEIHLHCINIIADNCVMKVGAIGNKKN